MNKKFKVVKATVKVRIRSIGEQIPCKGVFRTVTFYAPLDVLGYSNTRQGFFRELELVFGVWIGKDPLRDVFDTLLSDVMAVDRKQVYDLDFVVLYDVAMVQVFRTKNDSRGNRRRVLFAYDSDGSLLEVVYFKRIAPTEYADAPRAIGLPLTPRVFKKLRTLIDCPVRYLD